MQNKQMKAVVLHGNQDMRLDKISHADLDPRHYRIRIKNVGVCSSDIQRAFGSGAYFYPLIMGHEMSGEVVEVGKDLKKYSVSSRVVIFPLIPCQTCKACRNEAYQQCADYSYYGSRRNGGYAEYIDVAEWNLLPIPDSVSFSDAAAVEPLSVVVHALRRAKLIDADHQKNIAILGAGFLGLLMAQILKIKSPSSTITMIDRNHFKLNLAQEFADHIHLLKDNEDWQQYLKEHGKNAFDVTVEAAGVPDSFVRTVEMAAANGTVIWMGNITGDLTIPKQLVSSILRKELNIVGTWNSTYHPEKNDDWKDAIQLIAEGVQPSRLVTQWITLEEVPLYLQKLYNHKQRVEEFESIKVMVTNEECA